MNEDETQRRQTLLAALSADGFYRLTDEGNMKWVTDSILRFGDPFHEFTNRDYSLDGENIAEGDADSFVDEICDGFLQRIGICSSSRTICDSNNNKYYEVTIGEFSTRIHFGLAKHWKRACLELLELISRILHRMGASEVPYLRFSGNDSSVVFMSPNAYEIISDSQVCKSLIESYEPVFPRDP